MGGYIQRELCIDVSALCLDHQITSAGACIWKWREVRQQDLKNANPHYVLNKMMEMVVGRQIAVEMQQFDATRYDVACKANSQSGQHAAKHCFARHRRSERFSYQRLCLPISRMEASPAAAVPSTDQDATKLAGIQVAADVVHKVLGTDIPLSHITQASHSVTQSAAWVPCTNPPNCRFYLQQLHSAVII